MASITYRISSASRPVVFVSGTSSASGTVASIKAISGPTNGVYVWNITVLAGYTTRSSLDALKLYCFASVVGGTPTGFGMAIYSSSGELRYSTEFLPLVIKGAAVLNSVTTSGTSITTDIDTIGDVATAVTPSFLAVDWLRTTFKAYTSWFSPIGVMSGSGCVNGGSQIGYCAQTFAGLGFRVSGGVVIAGAGATGKYQVGFEGVKPASQFAYTSTRTAQLPLTIPVIDGALYD